MKPARILALASIALAAPAATASSPGHRQYYDSSYSYSNSYNYYYVRYYYKPTVSYPTYDYHYSIYYPTAPQYIYYYNPTTQAYWGRYEIGSKGDKRYSILAEKDRKKDLKDIPEAAFPAPAALPPIPGSDDKVAMEPPPENVPAAGSAKDAK